MTAVGTLASANRWIASSRRSGLLAGLHFPGENGIERGHRQGHFDKTSLGIGARRSRSRKISADFVTIATDDERGPALRAPCASPFLAFDRLIGIGIGSNRDRFHGIARRR